jgi:hypothetical protein
MSVAKEEIFNFNECRPSPVSWSRRFWFVRSVIGELRWVGGDVAVGYAPEITRARQKMNVNTTRNE